MVRYHVKKEADNASRSMRSLQSTDRSPHFDPDLSPFGAEGVQDPSATQVLILTYMRSGSTFVGELLNQNPNVTYWFEPLDGVYMNLYHSAANTFPIDLSHFPNGTRRKIPEMEHDTLSNAMLRLLTCGHEHVATEALCLKRRYTDKRPWESRAFGSCLSKSFAIRDMTLRPLNNALRSCWAMSREACDIHSYSDCARTLNVLRYNAKYTFNQTTGFSNLENLNKRLRCVAKLESALHECMPTIENHCHRFKVRAVKTIRLSMETVAHILDRNSQVKVIHLLRDPRGIVHSRHSIGFLSRLMRPAPVSPIVTEASILCEKMLLDINQRFKLQRMFPNNFLELHYEDAALYPYESYRKIYNFLNLEPSGKVENWIRLSTTGSGRREADKFNTFRDNSTSTAFRWKTELDEATIDAINVVCKDVLEYLEDR